MKKKVISFLVVILLVTILITPTMVMAAQNYKTTIEGGFNGWVMNSYDQGFFCMNHGLILNYGTKFVVYETGTLEQLAASFVNHTHAGTDGNGDNGLLLSFIVGDMERAANAGELCNGHPINNYPGGRDDEPWGQWIWYLLDGIKDIAISPSDFAELEEKYFEYKQIYDKAMSGSPDTVKIEAPNPDVVVADEKGIIGPFKITYPYGEKLTTQLDLKITVNDTNILFDKTNSINKLMKEDGSPFEIGDTEFYLSVDEVNYGMENNFHADWTFNYYGAGTYEKLTPQRILFKLYKCESCGTLQTWTALAHFAPSGIVYEKNWQPLAANSVINSIGKYATAPSYSFKGIDESNSHYPTDEEHYAFGTYKGKYSHQHKVWDDSTGAYMSGEEYIYDANIVDPEIRYLELAYEGTNPKYYSADKNYGLQNLIYITYTPQTITIPTDLPVRIGQPNIKILLNKINSLTKANVSGVEFEVSAEGESQTGVKSSEYANVSSDGGKTFANPITITTTDSDMEIEIKPDNEKAKGLINEITVTFKETGLADESEYLMYRDEYGDPGSVQITYEWDSVAVEWKYKEIKYPKYENGVEEKAEISDVEKNSWKLTAENRPKIEELSGYVWIDKPSGEKDINPPDGINNENEYKEGVKVFLYKSDGSQVEYDGYGERFGGGGEGYLVTDGNGEYKFENIPKLPDGESYYIVFEYDGINYICTKLGGDSKADETDRAGFNSKFVTISPGQSNGGIALNYNYSGNASTLITEDGDGVVYDDFAIKADTQTAGNTYTETATDINLGIVKKVLDLALMTDLYEVTATINGINPPTVKKYNAIFDNVDETVIDAMQNKTADGVEYNINLYRSDYNYRIGQYINSPSIAHQPSLAAEEITALQNSRAELVVTLEYKVLLANQSTTNASIDKFEYYYDSHLKFKNITGGVATDEGNKLTITPSNPNLGHGECKEVSLVFEAVNLSDEQVVKNYAEIIQYSTAEGGYVDCDSAPGNANIGSGAMQYEDDTDEAKGAKITLSLTDREVSGYVFEDKKEIVGDAPEYITGNGIYDNGETPVDDVIVQLIEIKNLDIAGNKHRLEYIWQETTSGSNIVRKISDDGTKIDTIQYQDIAPETGKYVFRGFIPGDYIVRFIYGDGTYKDTAINTANLLKYNGQDYKSTLDEKWNSNYLTTEGYSNADCSMARDNEARRLEVMAYAVGVTDGEDLRIDNVAKLENTWMAAETSKIVVEDCLIDGVSTFYRKSNFGLVEKPVTKLSLKKHIMNAELKDATGNAIIQASVPDVGTQYLEDSTVIENFRSGISVENAPLEATATTRTNRGYWQVEINNVDGATLTMKYKYIVTNTGEPDYLSQDLANKFKFSGKYEDDIKAYKEEIEKCAEEVKKAVKANNYKIEDTYLGHAYYSGKKAGSSDNKNGGDANVKAYVHLEDYLTDLSLDASGSFEEIKNESKKIINKAGNEETETVKVIRTKNGEAVTSNSTANFEATVKCAIADKRSFPSYIAQVITPITTLSGTKITDSTANNLEYVQSYYSVARLEDLGLGKGTESDEFWAETFRIIPTTGEDKESGLILTISITAGLAIIAIGIILIKRIIKE